jgi:adenosine deaminase
VATRITQDWLRRLPKAELHCHLDGSLRPSTLLDLAREYGVPLPAGDTEGVRRYMRVADARNLEEYLARFTTTVAVLQHADALERTAYELVEDAARDGVRYIEVRNAPILNVRGGLSLVDAVEATLKGLKRGEQVHGVIARFIVIALRHMPPSTSMELAELAAAFRGDGVVAFDLAGAELGYPAAEHAAAFLYARERDLACTCHAGEGDGAASVRQAVHRCGAHRLGHATRLIEDPSLTEYVNDRRIPLEICLTSNVQTHAASSYAEHPLRRYVDLGLNVVLNTDNRLMSDTTLTDEYYHAATDAGLSERELCAIAINGFDAAFLPWAERHALVERMRAEIATLSVDD